MKTISISLLVFQTLFIAQVFALGEILNPLISADPPNAQCVAAATVRPCVKFNGGIITSYPLDWPCPCHADGSSGGAVNGQGIPSKASPYNGQFLEEILVQGLTNPVGMSFTDNGLLFISTKEGVVWRVDLSTGEKHIWIDLTDEVCGSGDRGMLGITTNPNFQTTPFVFLLYSVDPIYGEPDEPMETPVNQRVTRYTDKGAMADTTSRLPILGGGATDGIPCCYNTHAIGSIKFGHDGSLLMTTGEGSHWDFDLGDFGQDVLPTDAQCELMFGTIQDVGAFRAQIHESLGGKVLRIDPGTGLGICADSGFPVKNPFCNGNSSSPESKIWATGLRNPFRMNIKPIEQGDNAAGPGVVYFGDVGEGGYEEVNAVTQGGLNFGWPCWEGPLPMPRMRDSPLTSTATLNGHNLTCNYMYQNVKTEMPFFFWSRFQDKDPAGYFAENAYLGQGFQGNTAAGVVVYTGKNYPESYLGSVFILDYSQWWIRVAHRSTGDVYDHMEDFYIGNTAMLTLETDPSGDVCYITLNLGQVRCFRYRIENVAPAPMITASPIAGIAPVTIQFSSDGTMDRENDPITFLWNFGDGTTSTSANPSHTYTTAGVYNVILWTEDKWKNTGNTSMTVYANAVAPKVTITTPTIASTLGIYNNGSISFSGTVVDNDPTGVTWKWEVQIVHLNHIHTGQAYFTTPSFTMDLAAEGSESHAGERITMKIIATVTDKTNLTGSDSVLLAPNNYLTLYGGNSAPVPSFSITGYTPFQVNQPVIFNAESSTDKDLDYIFYTWDFGDGNIVEASRYTSHSYLQAGTYTVKLTARDDFFASNFTTQTITIGAQSAIDPVVVPGTGTVYAATLVTMYSITSTASIYYTLDGSTPTAASTKYTTSFTIPYVPYSSTTIKAIAIATGLASSAIVTSTLTILPPPCSSLYVLPNCSLACSNALSPASQTYIHTVPPANGVNSVGAPPTNRNLVVKYLIDNIYGNYSSDTTNLHLLVDGGNVPGQAIQARVSYDWTNDGVWDRVEVFNLFAMDPDNTTFEEYTFLPAARFQPNGVTGDAYKTLTGGAIQLELWQAIGSGNPPIRFYSNNPSQSLITIPYNNTYQTTPSKCTLRCNGGFIEDVCHVCAGPGMTGCDQQCFSTKVYDSCGICGGVGPTGCDQKCYSNKVVGSCGVCGVAGNCIAPAPACNKLGIRSRCPDLVCGYLNWANSSLGTVPSAGGVASQGVVPAAAKVLEYRIYSMYGYYTVDVMYSKLHFYVDALANGGTAIQAALSYDFTGDGTWDRVEIFDTFTPNDLVGFELWQTSLLASSTGNWATLVNGTIRIQFWSAYPTNVPLYIMTDESLNGMDSYFTIPFITSYHGYNYTGAGSCGEVVIPPTMSTTGDVTTTTNMVTMGTPGSTTGGKSTTHTVSGSTGGSGVSSTGGSVTSTTGTLDQCGGCSCGNNFTCPCTDTSCQLINGTYQCTKTPKSDGTQCKVQFDAVCYEGVCASGACVSQRACEPTNLTNDAYKIETVLFVVMLVVLFVV